MHEEHPLGIRPAHGKDARIISGKDVAAFDGHSTAIESIADIERTKVDRRAATCRNVDLLRCDRFSVHDERHHPLCCRCVEACDHGTDAGTRGIFGIGQFRRSFHAFNGPVGCRGVFGYRMQKQLHIAWQNDVGKVRRHRATLHVAEKLHVDRPMYSVGKRAHRVYQFTEAGMTIAWLNAIEHGSKLGFIMDGLRQNIQLPAQCHDLRLVTAGLGSERREGLPLGLGKSRPDSHAEGVVQDDQVQMVRLNREVDHAKVRLVPLRERAAAVISAISNRMTSRAFQCLTIKGLESRAEAVV